MRRRLGWGCLGHGRFESWPRALQSDFHVFVGKSSSLFFSFFFFLFSFFFACIERSSGGVFVLCLSVFPAGVIHISIPAVLVGLALGMTGWEIWDSRSHKRLVLLDREGYTGFWKMRCLGLLLDVVCVCDGHMVSEWIVRVFVSLYFT
jgi:hypothetical protein